MLPRRIRLAASARALLRARFDAIDLAQPCPVTNEHWTRDRRACGRIGDPVAELCCAGWAAVPPLLDVLDDARSSPRARAFALALLFDITSLASPAIEPADAWSGRIRSLGRYANFGRWPGAAADPKASGGDDNEPLGPDEPDAAAQEPLIVHWRELRQSLVISE